MATDTTPHGGADDQTGVLIWPPVNGGVLVQVAIGLYRRAIRLACQLTSFPSHAKFARAWVDAGCPL